MKIIDLFASETHHNSLIKRPYIIAEAGVNHEGSMNLAYRLIEEAKEGGADAIKFQTYKAKSIASKNSPYYWDLKKEPTTSQYNLFKKYDKFWKNEFEKLKIRCDEVDIEFMSTPFDIESANFLNDMMDVYKISSSDITNKPFIQHICSFEKPIILSTGASNIDEIEKAISWIGNIPLSLLHCILNYPTNDDFANLGMIKDLQFRFPNKIIGYSDHTLPNKMKILEMATLLGASILEKHFTHDKNLNGNDHYHAMDKDDLRAFISKLDYIIKCIGNQNKHSIPSEEVSRKNARRSLVATRRIPVDTIIKNSDLSWKRPSNGISPEFIDRVLGKKTAKEIPEDESIQWDMLL
jgi:sialic acid synthase SpsE